MTAAAATAPESSRELMHRIRTPISHIVGFSALLIEEGSGNVGALERIKEEGESMVELVEEWLGPAAEKAGEVPKETRMAALKSDIAPRVNAVVRAVGALLSSEPESSFDDLLRIARACAELIAFVNKQDGDNKFAAV